MNSLQEADDLSPDDYLTIVANPALAYAKVYRGDEELRTCFGLSRWHAIGRAVKWAMQSTEVGIIYFPRQ